MDLVAERRQRPLARPAVSEELDDPELLARLELRAHGQPPQVGLALGRGHGALGAFDHVVHARGHPQAARARAVHEADPERVVGVVLGDQRRRQRRRRARVVRLVGAGLVRDQLGLHADADRRSDRLDLEQDRRDRPLHERHHPRRTHVDGLAGGRDPFGLSAQDPFAQIELPLVADQLPVPDVEWLVVDEQAEHLAVGHVDERLARLGIAVGGLGVRQRANLVEAVQERPGRPRRLALIEVPAQADVAVREREDRLGLGQQVEVELALAHHPRLDREDVGPDHRSRSNSSESSCTTTSAP